VTILYRAALDMQRDARNAREHWRRYGAPLHTTRRLDRLVYKTAVRRAAPRETSIANGVGPAVTFDAHTGLWTLATDLVIVSRGYPLYVAAGFTFDLSSVPRPVWPIIAPFELSIAAPTIHDWLYQHAGHIQKAKGVPYTQAFTRKDADQFLRDIALQEGVPHWRAEGAYQAVRLFGGKAWQGDAV
jgi:hypothetical protein